MEDRFKFRIWNPNDKVMKYDITIEFMECISLSLNEFFKNIYEAEGDTTIMQCTGLKDKTGKLIYEGDIAKINNDLICEVVRNQEYCAFLLKVYKGSTGYDKFNFNSAFINEKEIIGNKFENPELLEGVKYE